MALVEEARTQLTGSARQRFDAALAYAERVYPLREDNVLLTDQLPTGLFGASPSKQGGDWSAWGSWGALRTR